ncbi:ABC transporter substrate-binding protein, partial [Candidatus Poribacteria bacterium]|nr:ABC transporter substrate-binding protein [Candidatus Poribacteria bacterium]
GIPEKNTVDMVMEQINAAGGVNGNKIDVIVYDTATDPTTARTRIDKLINVDKVSVIIGPSTSGASLGIIDLVQNAQIPLVSCAASVKIVEPVEERKWVFKTPQSDVLVGEVIAEHLKEKAITKVAIITTSDGFGRSGKEQLEKLLPPAGVEIVAQEEFGEKDTDVLSQLTKIQGTEAEAVICWSVSGGGATVTKNMKADLNMEIPLIMSHGVANKAYIDLSGEAANGVIFPAGKLLVADELPDSDPQKAVLLKYTSDYKAKFNEEPNTFGGHAWDALQIVTSAMKKAGEDKAKIRDEIENTKDFVGTGGIFNFSPTDHNGLTKDGLVMVKIVDGDWTLLK